VVAEARTFVDVEGPLREYVRDQVASVNRRVFFEVNPKVPATLAQVIIQRIAGRDESCLIQFDVWAASKAAAAEIAAELATALEALAHFTAAGAIVHGATVESVRWQPDPESNAPRYIVEATVTATAHI